MYFCYQLNQPLIAKGGAHCFHEFSPVINVISVLISAHSAHGDCKGECVIIASKIIAKLY
jgi:hypothetical protein